MYYYSMQQYLRISEYNIEFKKEDKEEYIHHICTYRKLKIIQNHNM